MISIFINIGALKSRQFALVHDDIAAVVQAAGGRACTKVIIETSLLTDEEKVIASSLANDFLPYAWSQMRPTWADWGILAGSFGWFGMWFLLFARTFPVVAIQEIKEQIPMPRLRKGGH